LWPRFRIDATITQEKGDPCVVSGKVLSLGVPRGIAFWIHTQVVVNYGIKSKSWAKGDSS
jgi:hypothetical protein